MTQTKIYLPTKADNYNQAADEIVNHLSENYGGYTRYNAVGGWVSPDNEHITEPVHVFESYTDNDTNAVKAESYHLANLVKQITLEESVAYTVNQEMLFE